MRGPEGKVGKNNPPDTHHQGFKTKQKQTKKNPLISDVHDQNRGTL